MNKKHVFSPTSERIVGLESRSSDSIKHLCDHIISATRATRYGNTINAADWPADACYAVKYTLHDSQFPDVKHSEEVRYFTTMDDYAQWYQSKQKWIASTDFDFSIKLSFYSWDWGPVLKFSE